MVQPKVSALTASGTPPTPVFPGSQVYFMSTGNIKFSLL